MFGAFLTGLITPHQETFAVQVAEKLEDLVFVFFIPLYFAYSGLQTHLTELYNDESWFLFCAAILSASFGKILGCFSGAKLSGLSWRESLTIGVLMNTRGVIELIVLNLGLESKVISEKLFAAFIAMSLVTTFLTVPLVSFIFPKDMYKRYEPSFSDSEISNSGSTSIKSNISTHNPLKVLACLENDKVMPSTILIFQALFKTQKPITIFALRLLHKENRASNIMIQSDSINTLKHDTCINVFRSFGNLYKYPIKSLFTVSPRSAYHADILEASKDLFVNMVYFPINVEKNTFPNGWANSVIEKLFASILSTLIILLDRGFGKQDKQSTLNNAFEEAHINEMIRKQKIVVLCASTVDELELLLFLEYLSVSQMFEITVKLFNEPIPCCNFVLDRLVENDCKLEQLMSRGLHEAICGVELIETDLIFVAFELYLGLKDFNGCENNWESGRLKQWFNNDCNASVLIIKAGLEKEIVEF